MSRTHVESQLRPMRLPNGAEIVQLNDAETALLYREIFVERSWLPAEFALRPGDVVLDVGANVGLASLFFLDVCPGVHVVAFEPAPLPYEALCRNLAPHAGRVDVRNYGLGARDGSALLGYYRATPGMSGFRVDPVADAAVTRTFLTNSGLDDADAETLVAGKHAVDFVECDVRSLSSVIVELGLYDVAYLKVDAEKTEIDVLRGVEEAHWPLFRQVAVEVHDLAGELDLVLGMLRRRGFRARVHQAPLLAGTGVQTVYAVRPS